MSEPIDRDLIQPLIEQIQGIRVDFRGQCLAQAVFKMSLVFDQRHAWETRRKVLLAVDLYQRWVPPGALTWWVAEGGRPKELGKHPVPTNELQALAEDPKAGIAFAMGGGEGAVASRFESAQPFTLYLNCSDDDMPGTGILELFFPVEWVVAQSGNWSFVSLANGLMERLQPLHATAGLGLVFPKEGGHFRRTIGESFLIYPIAKRHPGLEIISGLHFKQFLTSIYTVNWLNYLREEMLAPLGGRAAVVAACQEAGLPTQDLGRCLLIQAGPGPAPGDTEVGQDLPGYRAAMKILKPIRVAKFSNIYIAPPPHGIDDREMSGRAALAYLTRFDDEPVPYPV